MQWAGMTQQEFSAKLKVSPATISSIFSGRTRPTNMQVMAIHKAFPEINTNWLMFGEGEMLVGGSPAQSSVSQFPEGEELELIPESPATRKAATASRPVRTPSPTGMTEYTRQALESTSAVSGMTSGAFVRDTKIIDKPARKITEIRVFYDDGTFESFIPPKRT